MTVFGCSLTTIGSALGGYSFTAVFTSSSFLISVETVLESSLATAGSGLESSFLAGSSTTAAETIFYSSFF